VKDRGTLYVGILLVAFGILFMFTQGIGAGLRTLGVRFGWGQMWPFLILFVGFAFWLPLALWWEQRHKIAGLVIPATLVTANGLILLYQNLAHDWQSWAYVWTLEPLSVGVGLALLYLLTNRDRGLLTAAAIVSGVGLFLLVIFASAFGGTLLRILGPAALILIGILIVYNTISRRPKGHLPDE
jgi:hypothetical protein